MENNIKKLNETLNKVETELNNLDKKIIELDDLVKSNNINCSKMASDHRKTANWFIGLALLSIVIYCISSYCFIFRHFENSTQESVLICKMLVLFIIIILLFYFIYESSRQRNLADYYMRNDFKIKLLKEIISKDSEVSNLYKIELSKKFYEKLLNGKGAGRKN